MKNVYVLAGIVCVVIIGGAWAIRSAKSQTVPPAGTPTPTITQPMRQEAVAPETQPAAGQSISETMKPRQYTNPPPVTIDPKKEYTATIATDKGAMTIRLFASESPVTVNNFVFLAREGFYRNTVFHRVIRGFMIQGGDPLGTGTGGPGYRFADEKITREYTRGTLAMANSGPNTNGSQFFIMHQDNPLPKNYVIFGAVDPSDSSSLATLDAIASQPVTSNGSGEDSKPITPTVIQSIRIKEE